MYLIEILLPRMDNAGHPFPMDAFDHVRQELADHYGGVTAFLRSPASGLWQDDSGILCSDDIVTFEVMSSTLDRTWWQSYRVQLEQRFRQKEIVVRAISFERL
jgi:hypothetical protein